MLHGENGTIRSERFDRDERVAGKRALDPAQVWVVVEEIGSERRAGREIGKPESGRVERFEGQAAARFSVAFLMRRFSSRAFWPSFSEEVESR